MSANTLFLFGDQTGEILPPIQELNRLCSHSQNLSAFLQQSTDRLHGAISTLSADQRQPFPNFNSPLELASALSGQKYSIPALSGALLCISQIGHVILHLESNPRALDNSQGEVAIFGICTGLLSAAAVSCCRNLTELMSIAVEIVHLAFQIGLEASLRSHVIDPSPASWATLVTNIEASTLRNAIQVFNESYVLEPSQYAFLSAESAGSATVSGPPSTTKHLFEAVPLFQRCKRIPLPISAAFHAEHLPPISRVRTYGILSQPLLGLSVQHRLLISPSSGVPLRGNTFGDLLAEVADEIFQKPILFESYIQGLGKVLSPRAKALTCGPANSARAITQALQALGVELDPHDSAEPQGPMRTNDNAIAIVGMSIRLPGSETLEEFWKVLEDGRDLHEKIRPDRFDIGSHFDPTGETKNTTLTPYGVFIDRPGYFDTRLFNMSPREAAQTDPQQRLMLLTTYEALEMAGYSPNATPSTNTKRIGSFIGQTGDDYREVNASQDVDTYFITGGIRAFGPGRLNYHFGWEGPSYSIDTACSSSAASIQLACSALLSRECDMAVGGGANLLTASDLFAGLSRGSFLSKTGSCKTFDHDADGYVRADAVGVVVLKRVADAIADRDNILAVLRGVATNHSAEAVSITHPHAPTQERLFETVLNQAGLQPDDIDYAELHGTGTQAGDATESRSVTNVLARGRASDKPLYIGTAKPNLGHGEAASGVTSLIKAIMMLRKNMIPPHVGIKGRINEKLPPLAELNTHISFGKTPFLPRPTGDGRRRILINNFDAAGGNTSMVIEDAPILTTEGVDPRGHHVVPISGKTPSAVLGNHRRLLEYLRSNPDVRVEDVAYTLSARRFHHGIRKAHVASTIQSLVSSLEHAIAHEDWVKAPSTPCPIVFVFTGQGSQYFGMASELFSTNTAFRGHLEGSARICVSHGFESFLPIIQEQNAFSAASPVQMQLAIVAIELAVAAWWRSLGVIPSAVLGHSLGEYPALCVAGVISLSDCLYLVGRRASLMVAKCTPGTHSMLSIQASQEQAKAYFIEFGATGCEIACVNGPNSTVVSGPAKQIRQLREELKIKNLQTTLLEVPFAFHSGQMDEYLDEFEAVAEKAQFRAPNIPVASTVIGSVVRDSGVFSGKYLCRGARQPVEFQGAVDSLLEAFSGRKPTFIETGPNPTCLGLLRAILGDAEGSTLLPSLKRKEKDSKILSSSISSLFTAGINVDWREFHRPYDQSLRLLELPHYAFDLKNYWIQYEGDWAIRKNQKAGVHPNHPQADLPKFSTTSLHRIETEFKDPSEISVTFVTEASEPKLNKALRGHLVNGAGLCPSSVYADMAFTAARYLQTKSTPTSNLSMDVKNMEVHKPLLIQPGDTKQIIRVTATSAIGADHVKVTFSSQDGLEQQDHAHCIVALGNGHAWKAEWAKAAYLVKSRINHLIQSSARGETHKILRPMVYKLFKSLVDYDVRYQGLREVYMDSNVFEAAANVKFNTTEEDGTFTYSPYWIDSLAHISGFVLNGADTTPDDSVYISHGWGSMKIVGELSAQKEYQSYVRMQETATKGVMAGDVYFFEGETVVAVCQDLKFQRIKRTILDHLLPPSSNQRNIWKSDAIPSQPRTRTSEAPELPTIHVELAPEPRDIDFTSVLKLVASEVGVDISELVDDAEFADLGVDSLLSISITAKLGQLLSQPIPVGIFTECLTVRDLREYLDSSSNADGNIFTPDESEASDDDEDVSDIFSLPASRADNMFSRTGQSIGTPAENRPNIIKEIIAAEVGVDMNEIDDDTPLADLGVDSLLSLSILSAIKSQTGRILPSTFLIDHPTLSAIQSALGSPSHLLPPQQLFKALESAIHGTSSFKATSILLRGTPSSPHPSLFLLPDGSGSASSYVPLAPHLHLPGPVYGLNSPFLDSPQSFRNIPLEKVATIYLEEIRRIQPNGPYNLAGWSIGGTYAFEIASQLIQKYGEEVESLTLIDSPCPKKLPPLPIETIGLLEKVGAFDGLKSGKAAGIRDGVKKHFEGSVGALKGYKPIALPKEARMGKVTAIWAKYGVWETVSEETKRKFAGLERGNKDAARDWMMDPRRSFGPAGWDELITGMELKCEVVKGDHFSVMRKPGVLELGERLREAVCGK
ncbi:putative polyketide synthase [Cladorrhinum sp. PSN259]|nr:putative polyketide synthase [Cladorrhinum sp. PSN259]